MKKLMIAAGLAACATGVFAEEIPDKVDPQVYDMTITVKSSWCNSKNELMPKFNSDCDLTGAIVYRQQYTYKLAGAFWGCDCDVIGAPVVWGNSTYPAGATNPYEKEGFLFWDATQKGLFASLTESGVKGWKQSFKWDVLNILGKKLGNVEGKFNLCIKNKDGSKNVVDLIGAGYGTAKIEGVGTCESILNLWQLNKIKSMKGYVVGTFALKEFTATISGCKYCGKTTECGAFQFCGCGTCAAEETTDLSPAFGTWTLSFNSSAVKKLEKGAYIMDADSKIPSKVRDAMRTLPAIEL